ncbi:MAG: helix-turn-helix domain-containing protein [Prevotellaceae bacterium]|jgi:transcriptional regulator with XRE-family HTH domain|nr:helix-turn-helix domain-containing protein [Prevotellaceae bacterium]
MKSDKIHIGSIIKQKVKQRSLSVTEFARRINLSRGAVYNIYESASVDVQLLQKISDVLGYDFIENHYTNIINNSYEYILIVYLNETEIPDTLPENAVLLRKTNKNQH